MGNFLSVMGAILSFLVVISSGEANAAFVSMKWKNPGDGLITFDSKTKLEWLDLTVTAGLSYTAVLNQIAPGGALEGFRFATYDEVDNLFSDFGLAGIPTPGSSAPGDNPGTIVSDEVVTDFIDLFGQTDCFLPCSGAAGAFGFLGSPMPNSNVLVAGPWHHNDGTSKILSFFVAEYSTGAFGSYLVTDHPPTKVLEPENFAIFGIALIALAGLRCRDARKFDLIRRPAV